MKFRNLDSNSDWRFGHGLSDYISGEAAIALNIQTRIFSWLNDCFFDMGAGIDWNNRLGSKNQRNLLELDLRRIILQSYGVTGLVSFSTNITNRKFTANYNVQTIYSPSYQATLTKDLGNA